MAYTEFTCRSGGSNLNAGTLDGSAEAATSPIYTSAGNWDGNTIFTPNSGTNPVSSGVAVGQWASIYLTSGTTVTGFVAYVTAVNNAVNGTITVSSTYCSNSPPASGTGTYTIRVGGAWQGPNGSVGFPLNFLPGDTGSGYILTNPSGNLPRVNLKNDQTYSITAGITSTGGSYWSAFGYSSTFGDGGYATIDGGTTGASYNLLTANTVFLMAYIKFNNNGATASLNGVYINTASITLFSVFYKCVFSNMRGNGVFSNTTQKGSALLIECEAYACNKSNTANYGGFNITTAFGTMTCVRCVSHDNSGSNSSGFVGSGSSNNVILHNCIADTNGAYGLNSKGNAIIVNSDFYNNANSGVVHSGVTLCAQNSIFSQNGGYGLEVTSSMNAVINNCAFYSNTSGQTSGVDSRTTPLGSITLSGDPFTAAASGDFGLNNTAGAGASCRAAAVGTFTQTQAGYSGAVSYPDIGAAQHQDAGGGGSVAFSTIGRMIG